MYKGNATKGLEFYNLLLESDKFTTELGKVNLVAGKLEAEMILYYSRKGVTKKLVGLTLGRLIEIGKENNLLDKNQISALKMVCNQRNYFIHNIYSLFTDLIDETILPKNNLIDTDVITYTDYAWKLKDNLEGLAQIFIEWNEPITPVSRNG